MLRVLSAMWLACLAGAALGAEAKSPDFAAADATSKAFVLLSTSAASTSMAAGTMLKLLRITSKGDKIKLKQIDGFFLNNPFVKSHSATEHMNVHWRALEPGDYVLEDALVNPTACWTKITSFRFSVVGGQALYLGDFRVENNELAVRNQYERDRDYFLTHTRGMTPESFTPALPDRVVKDNPRCL